MTMLKVLASLLAIGLGAFFVVYGERDDSPGGQLLGLVIAVAGIIGAIRIIRNRKRESE